MLLFDNSYPSAMMLASKCLSRKRTYGRCNASTANVYSHLKADYLAGFCEGNIDDYDNDIVNSDVDGFDDVEHDLHGLQIDETCRSVHKRQRRHSVSRLNSDEALKDPPYSSMEGVEAECVDRLADGACHLIGFTGSDVIHSSHLPLVPCNRPMGAFNIARPNRMLDDSGFDKPLLDYSVFDVPSYVGEKALVLYSEPAWTNPIFEHRNYDKDEYFYDDGRVIVEICDADDEDSGNESSVCKRTFANDATKLAVKPIIYDVDGQAIDAENCVNETKLSTSLDSLSFDAMELD